MTGEGGDLFWFIRSRINIRRDNFKQADVVMSYKKINLIRVLSRSNRE